jgi:hypothetical protein
MDENLHKDNLEEFFRKSFEEQKSMPPEEDWDMPSNNIWGGISSGISVQKPMIPFYQNWKFWAISVAAISMVVFYQFWTYQQRYSQFSEQLNTQTEAFESLKETLQSEQKKVQNLESQITTIESNIESNNTTNNNTQKPDNQFIEIKNNQKNQNQKSSKKATNTNLLIKEEAVENQILRKEKNQLSNESSSPEGSMFSTSKEQLPASEKSDKKTQKKERIFASNISKITTQNALISFENSTYLNIDFPKVKNVWTAFNKQPIVPSSNKNWSLTAHASPLFAKRNSKLKMPNFNRPMGETDLVNPSYGLGLNLSYHPNKKWSIWSGLSYQNLDLASNNRLEFKYSEMGAFDDEKGLKTRDYDIEMSSTFADLVVEFRVSNDIQNDGFDYQEGAPVLAKVESNLHMETIGIPIGVARHFEFGKWSLSLKAAAIPTFVISDDLSINKIHFPDNRLQVKSAKFKVNPYRNHINNFTFDGQLAVGIHYEITPNLQLDLAPTVRTNLTPFFETSRVQSTISSLAFQAGVTYIL